MYLYSYVIKLAVNDVFVEQSPREEIINAPNDQEAMYEIDDIKDALESVRAIIVREKLEEGRHEGDVFMVTRTIFSNAN